MVTAAFKQFGSCLTILFLLASSLSAETVPLTESGYPISQKELRAALRDVEALINKGAWLDAEAQYQTLLQYDLPASERETIRSALEELNLKLLFSPILTPDSFQYTVEPGDSLYKIARKFNTTIDLVKKSNHLETDLIRPGMGLKISKAAYSIVVDKSSNELKLYADGETLKTYAVATGSGDRTPIGSFTIESKLADPVWYRAGAIVPPDSPENILGSRWLGFSLPGYGIHGTTMPESIGQHVTDGCVRMHNRDVEELSSIVPLKTKVTVVE